MPLIKLAYCAHYDHVDMPAACDDVHGFIDQRTAAVCRRKATVHISPAFCLHRLGHGWPNPMDSTVALDYWKDLVHERVDCDQLRTMPITLDLVETMVTALDTELSATRRVVDDRGCPDDHGADGCLSVSVADDDADVGLADEVGAARAARRLAMSRAARIDDNQRLKRQV